MGVGYLHPIILWSKWDYLMFMSTDHSVLTEMERDTRILFYANSIKLEIAPKQTRFKRVTFVSQR